MTVGFRIEGQETNTEQNNHKNDGIVECRNEKTLLHEVFSRQHNFASKEDLSFFCSSKITFSMSIESGKSALLRLFVMSVDQE